MYYNENKLYMNLGEQNTGHSKFSIHTHIGTRRYKYVINSILRMN